MVASSIVGLSMIALMFIVGLTLVLRKASSTGQFERKRSFVGMSFASVYLLLWLGSLLLWRGNDGFGIAAVIWGIPWSFLSATLIPETVLNALGLMRQPFVILILLGGIALNALALYTFGHYIQFSRTSFSPTVQA